VFVRDDVTSADVKSGPNEIVLDRAAIALGR
jgi:hypothetical protein